MKRPTRRTFSRTSRPTTIKPILKEKYRRGYLTEVTNKTGTKKPLYIADTMTGYTAFNTTTGRKVRSSPRNPEKLAKDLAKEGYKKVTIRD